MGAKSSSLSELPDNEYLRRLSGTESISPNDPFWNQLLSYSFQINRSSADNRLLEESVGNLLKNLAIYNCGTGNFGALIQVFISRATELRGAQECEDGIFTWQTYNALFIIRTVCKYFVENLSEEVVLQQLDASAPDGAPNGEVSSSEISSNVERLMLTLMELIMEIKVVDQTYALLLEAVNTLLILLAVQMFQTGAASHSRIYQYLLRGKCSLHAGVFTKMLLQLFVSQVRCPAILREQSQHGLLYGLTAAVASGLWTLMTLGYGTKKAVEERDDALLAKQSLLLLLVVTSHCTTQNSLQNPYRESLFCFTNSLDPALNPMPANSTPNVNAAPTNAGATFKTDYAALYQTLCDTLSDDQTTLLLYLLMHRNSEVKAYLLSRINIDVLVLPLLRTLYRADECNSHHIYMALIVLLILSEDDDFNKAVHETTLTSVLWFKERVIREISLGGLLILVVIRTIHHNMTRMRDKYLHTNCLAALANMSARFRDLHPYVTQRIVSLFALLLRKHTRLVDHIRASAETGADESVQNDQVHDLQALEDVIRMVLEIINSCLSSALHVNLNLIYTLLYQRSLFVHFRSHPTFQDIIQNIDMVLTYFSDKLEPHDVKNLGVQEILSIINQSAQTFRRDHLKKFPELKFKYVEEESPEEFFIPYIWSLVYHSSGLYFNANRIQLFSPSPASEEALAT